jgi:hypothetical protein
MSGIKVGKWIRNGNDIEVIIPSAEPIYKGRQLPKHYTFTGSETHPVKFLDIEKYLKEKLNRNLKLKRGGTIITK